MTFLWMSDPLSIATIEPFTDAFLFSLPASSKLCSVLVARVSYHLSPVKASSLGQVRNVGLYPN